MKLSFTFLSLIFFLSFSAQAQMSKKEIRKKQWLGDLSVSGVGIELYTPNFGEFMTANNRWVGANMLFGPITFGIGQGSISTFEPINEFMLEPQPFVPTGELRANKIYIGTSIPLSILTVGQYRSFNNSFRGHPIINMTFGGYRIYEGFTQTKPARTTSFFNVAPGYRLRLPFASVDFNLNMRLNFFRDGQYQEFQKKGLAIYPQITLRWEGLLDRFNPTFRSVEAANVSTSNHRTESTTTREGNYRVTRTTTTYDVHVTPTSVTVTDIGLYGGIGLKYGRNGVRTANYMGNSNLFGAQFMYRKANLLLGFNIEGGRVGHGSSLQSGSKGTVAEGTKFSRRVSRHSYEGIGSYSVFNVLVDVGVNINNLLLAAGGTVVAYNEATSFLAFNIGYSFGFGIVGGQRFEDPGNSIVHYANMENTNRNNYNRDNTHFEDPRKAKSGRAGGLFISCDIGHASLRMQWYRYRRAPMANGLMFSLAWRLG